MLKSLAVLIVAFIVLSFFVFSNKDEGIASPIPRAFGNSKLQFVNKWFPKESVKGVKDGELALSAKSAIITNFETEDVLFAKNENERLPAASVVKIMTALVALEHNKLTDSFTVSEKAAKVGENSMVLTQGEKLTLRELLYGLMLVSGNDAAVTIAEGVSGSEDAFVGLMNDKAKELGLKNTKFVNASGLDVDGQEQYSTAYDLSVIAHTLWENHPEIREITSTYHYYIDATVTHKDFELYNDTNLLTTYPGVRGIKPGFTWEAGLCLVTYAENGGKKLLAVILGSDDRRGEMKELLDYGFSKYGIKVDHPGLDLRAN